MLSALTAALRQQRSLPALFLVMPVLPNAIGNVHGRRCLCAINPARASDDRYDEAWQ
jgi:hypothetical protein